MQVRRTVFVISLLVLIAIEGMSQCLVIQDQIDTYLYTDQDFGQSFKVCESGSLNQLDVRMHHFLNGEIQAQLSIFQGEGYDGELLYSSEISLADDWGSSFSHILLDPLSVSYLDTYTFKVEYFGEFGVMWGNFTDQYDDGAMFWNGEIQESIDMGFTLHIVQLQEDVCFEWNGSVDQNWNNPFNWSPQLVPDSLDCVLIPSTETSNYPLIAENARVADMTIEQDAQLFLTNAGRLFVHGSLNSYGQVEYDGEVVLRPRTSSSEINGSPVFHHLTIEGILFTTESIEILNILDLTNGYLVNLGSEVYLNTGNGYAGHAYMPNEMIQGHLIIKKHIDHFGEQIIGLPFSEFDEATFTQENHVDEFFLFKGEQGISNFNENWAIPFDFYPQGFCDAIRLNTAESTVLIEGQSTNEEITVSGSNSLESVYGQLQLISNPFPSMIDLDELNIPEGASTAFYKWLPEKQQFGSRNGGYATHELNGILHPADAVIVQLEYEQQLKFVYKDMAIEPMNVFETKEEQQSLDHMFKIDVIGDSGSDQLIVRLDNEASFEYDLQFDALKIPSLNPLVPVFASVDAEMNVLSINVMPNPGLGSTLPLYMKPGMNGEFSFQPILIDLEGVYDQLILHDKKNNVFHDFMENGAYWTESFLGDDDGRFELIFGSTENDNSDQEAVESMDVQEEDISVPEWSISAYEDMLVISGGPHDFFGILEISVHSLEGRLLFQEKLNSSSNEWQSTRQLPSGVYLISIVDLSGTHSTKFWVD